MNSEEPLDCLIIALGSDTDPVVMRTRQRNFTPSDSRRKYTNSRSSERICAGGPLSFLEKAAEAMPFIGSKMPGSALGDAIAVAPRAYAP